MKKRILICEFHQETDTFNPVVCRAPMFNAGGAFEGQKVFEDALSIRCAVHGGADAIAAAGGEAIPTIFMTANSGGRVDDALLREMKERMEYYVQAAGEYDGIFAALHGATCTETCDDACGELLAHLRKLAGDKPIAASFDLHANITEQVLKNADVVCGYQTYPHLDFYEVGYRAAALLMEKLSQKEFHMAAVHIPMLIPPAGYTSNTEPFKSVIQAGHAMVESGKLLDFSVFAVQPWLDIPEIASVAVAIGADTQVAERCAEELAEMLFALRDEVQPEMLTVDEIIDIAEKNTSGKPVILADSADSPNGGAVGDSPVVAMRLLERGSTLKAGMFVVDPEAVKKAFELGVGGEAEFYVGAGFTPGMPGPLKAHGRVCSLHDGYFTREGPAERGAISYIGNAAVVRFGTVDILLCEKGGSSGDPQYFRHFGIEPSLYDLIVVKANTSFRVPYGKISDLIYVADTPGAGASNLKQMEWKKLPKGLYPLDLPEDYKIEKAKIW